MKHELNLGEHAMLQCKIIQIFIQGEIPVADTII